jgi:phosphoglycerol transferase MdoB-like AlkP superfamily enzyme
MHRLKTLWRDAPDASARLQLALLLGAAAFAVFTLLRLSLLTVLATPAADRSAGNILLALASGALRDFGVALLFALFFAVVLNIKRRPFRKFGRGFIYILVTLGLFLLFFSAIAEVLFWNEFDSRLDGIALYYLMFPREVIGNLQQSFNIALYLPMVIAAAAGTVFLARKIVARALDEAPVKGARLRETALVLLALLIVLPAARSLPADVGANREINQLAENGWRTFIAAALTNDQDYDGVYPTMDEQEAIRRTRNLVAQDNTTFIDPANVRSIRRWTNNGKRPKKLNIVIVTNESFGSKFITVLDNQDGKVLTPSLDKLSAESLFFTNIYASGDRTVRGLEATETAFTPIPGISTARRAESKDMYSLPFLLKSFGYQSAVLYGGRAAFDNMGAFWSSIGFNPVWDESDIRHDSFTTAWGVSDEDLYTEALQRMDEMAADKKPFLLTMMTVSNHRPYRFPEDHIKFDPSMTNRQNSARYADWAYGDFIERAKAHKWFDNTVFVFVADHSEKINGAAQVPLQDMRIPILIYAPRHIAPQSVSTLGAQIDLIPTLLGKLGFSYVNPFFGKDLLRVPRGGGWSSTAHNFSVAFARPGHVAVLLPREATKGYAFEPGLTPLRQEAPDPETMRDAIALTQTAHHMFYAHQYHMPDDGNWPLYTPAVVAHVPPPAINVQ